MQQLTLIPNEYWAYECLLCKTPSGGKSPIVQFMREHAHGLNEEYIKCLELIKHRDGSVTFQLHHWVWLKSREDGDKKRIRKFRRWIYGRKYYERA